MPIRIKTIAPSLCHRGRGMATTDPRPSHEVDKKASALVYRNRDKWFRINLIRRKECDMSISVQPPPQFPDQKVRPIIPLTPPQAVEDLKGKRRMVRLTVTLPSDLVEQVRDAVYWTPGITLAWVIGQGIQKRLAELHTANRGPFPKRAKPLRAGRPKLLGQSTAIGRHFPGPLVDNSSGGKTA